MPTSLDPQPAENEIECARCGAHIYYELTRCPVCGVNLYEPEDDLEPLFASPPRRPSTPLIQRLRRLFHHLTRKPYKAEDVFGSSLERDKRDSSPRG